MNPQHSRLYTHLSTPPLPPTLACQNTHTHTHTHTHTWTCWQVRALGLLTGTTLVLVDHPVTVCATESGKGGWGAEEAEEASFKWRDESDRDYGHAECREGNLMGETMLVMRYGAGGWGGGKWRCPSAALLRIKVCTNVRGCPRVCALRFTRLCFLTCFIYLLIYIYAAQGVGKHSRHLGL
jgi:hypothetical protein